MSYYIRLGEFMEIAESEAKICKRVLQGEKVQCPYCSHILEKDADGVYCNNGDFKKYITPELMKLKGYELLTIGEVPRLSIVLKSDKDDEDDIVNVDFIEGYNNYEIIYRENSANGYSEVMKVKIADIERISSWIMIK